MKLNPRSAMLAAAGFAGILILSFYSSGENRNIQASSMPEKADRIVIDTLKQFGRLEKPSVLFPHDLHTDALAKKGKDCGVCHLETEIGNIFTDVPFKAESTASVRKRSPRFMRNADTDKTAAMDIYHLNCVGCHSDTAVKGNPSGPIVCGECHVKNTGAPSRTAMGFDKSLHSRHAKALDRKCESCHHAWEESGKTLAYAKFEEGSCRYCHKARNEENRLSMQAASHLSCIDCHMKTIANGRSAGPVRCAGCHDARERESIAKLDRVPRFDRNQPDHVLIGAPGGDDGSKREIKTTPVPFDHKAHEKYNDTCRACHHASLEKCGKCHTPGGSPEGGGISLEQSMHSLKSMRSCNGCHQNAKAENASCAGCHAAMPVKQNDPDACKKCHLSLPKEFNIRSPENETRQTAAALLDGREKASYSTSMTDIPKTVKIRIIENRYAPVSFPHRRIIRTLQENAEKSKLVEIFHAGSDTICGGCHHNSPPTKNPPDCVSCHDKTFAARDMLKPGLIGAYHRQCMGCHENMKLAKPEGCTGCHAENDRPPTLP